MCGFNVESAVSGYACAVLAMLLCFGIDTGPLKYIHLCVTVFYGCAVLTLLCVCVCWG